MISGLGPPLGSMAARILWIIVALDEALIVGGHHRLEPQLLRQQHGAVKEGEFALGWVRGDQADLGLERGDGRQQLVVLGQGIDGIAGDIQAVALHVDDTAPGAPRPAA